MMDIKAVLAVAAVVLLSIVGVNYYNSHKAEQRIAERKADIAAMQATMPQSSEPKAVAVKAAPTAPVVVQEAPAAEMVEHQPESEYRNLDFEKEDRAKLDDVMRRWGDASAIASRTSRVALPSVVKDLQAINREAEKLNVTPCLTKAKDHMLTAMSSEIMMYLKFMSDPDTDISGDMMQVYKSQEQYYKIIKICTD